MVSFNRRIVRILEETGMVEMDVLTAASSVARDGEQSVTEYLLEKELIEEGGAARPAGRSPGCASD